MSLDLDTIIISVMLIEGKPPIRPNIGQMPYNLMMALPQYVALCLPRLPTSDDIYRRMARRRGGYNRLIFLIT